MKNILIKLIEMYQKLPIATHKMCRFYPTCSNYAKQAISEYGCIKGIYLSIKRILRCNPWNKNYGYDPIPMITINNKNK